LHRAFSCLFLGGSDVLSIQPQTETTVLQWSQSPDDDPGEKSGQQVTVVGFELMKCREQHGGTDLYGA
jgi:hypothetical protein